ncbi:RNA binding domain-containing protein [Microsporum canis CBS 113480]|uniref:RNA binding domain-containing protein n=1 Tax=Arthroderma otae (strain ATCC MYA-4605 / CBS 113480) TaxID=554155 RepID=C5FHA5_ARTOC|nr:RNA binding domain-containing protein [Microsporum canis CBS 113480]EEQ28824.1 RNA binding domain-containing protein [Microsporum canis CBS 113480]
MDQSLDEIIAERPNASRSRGRTANTRPRRNNYRDTQKVCPPPPIPIAALAAYQLPYRIARGVNLPEETEQIWTSRSSRPPRQPRTDRYNSGSADQDSRGAKIRVNNIHYDLTQEDLEELFTRIGPVHSVSLLYDRAGRSEGVAFVTYKRLSDAQTAIQEFDGANAKGQPIRLSLVTNTAPRRRNPFDSAEMPKGSLFDRAERPRGRDSRSLSPEAETSGGRRDRRNNSKLAPPDNIDRYIPGHRSPIRKHDSGRNRGRRGGREPREGTDSRTRGSGRTKKTQEELDQEMEDYWGKANAGADAATGAGADANQTAQPSKPAPATGGEEDIDMIE